MKSISLAEERVSPTSRPLLFQSERSGVRRELYFCVFLGTFTRVIRLGVCF